MDTIWTVYLISMKQLPCPGMLRAAYQTTWSSTQVLHSLNFRKPVLELIRLTTCLPGFLKKTRKNVWVCFQVIPKKQLNTVRLITTSNWLPEMHWENCKSSNKNYPPGNQHIPPGGKRKIIFKSALVGDMFFPQGYTGIPIITGSTDFWTFQLPPKTNREPENTIFKQEKHLSSMHIYATQPRILGS